MPGYFHQTIVVGTVGRDPTKTTTSDGQTSIVNLSIAVNEYWNDRQTNERRERVTWYNVSFFGRLADSVHQYVNQGTNIMVVGTVSTRVYQARDQSWQASLDLRGQSFQLLGSRSDRDSSSGGGGSSSGGSSYDNNYGPPPQDVDDIPF